MWHASYELKHSSQAGDTNPNAIETIAKNIKHTLGFILIFNMGCTILIDYHFEDTEKLKNLIGLNVFRFVFSLPLLVITIFLILSATNHSYNKLTSKGYACFCNQRI